MNPCEVCHGNGYTSDGKTTTTCTVCCSPDEINPPHYQLAGGRESIDFIVDICRDLPGDEACFVRPIIEYVTRYRKKHDQPLTDLRKARWNLNRLINLMIAKDAATKY